MLKNVMCTVVRGLLAAACLPAGSVVAQQPVMDEFYGNGVHNFYDRDFFQAMQNLSVAIDGGSKDPRAYYYRGLAKMRSGDTYGAQADMHMGATYESADVDQFYPVSKSLERVQGAERRELERYRALARAQARDRQLRRDAVRYEQRRRSEAQVLRSVPVGPAPAPLGVAPATAIGGPAPAAVPGAAVAPPVAAPPATPPPPSSDDPFASPAADAPASDSPFDAPAETPPAAAPAAAPPVAVPPTPPAAAPPATPPATEPASDDPFSDAPAAEAPAAEAPAAAAPAAEAPAAEPAASDDPFADDPK